MKKGMVLGLASLFILTGCGSKNKITCTQTMSEDGVKLTSKIIGYVDGNKIKSIDYEFDAGSKEMAQLICSMYDKAKCSGSTAKISGDDALDMAGITSDDLAKLTKAEFKKEMESGGYKCK